jgi:D-sedoheptulose 7-phosphate isomerase
MKNLIANYLTEHNRIISSLDIDEINNAIELILETIENGGRVATCGNGGSATTASHYITDWNKMYFTHTRKKFDGICLSDNIGLMTAYANDLSYNDVFSEQVKYLLQPNDLLITISGSGNSANVLKATHVANNLNVKTLSICGYDGGQLKNISKHSVWVKSFDMQICEDAHVLFGHIVMKTICGCNIVS